MQEIVEPTNLHPVRNTSRGCFLVEDLHRNQILNILDRVRGEKNPNPGKLPNTGPKTTARLTIAITMPASAALPVACVTKGGMSSETKAPNPAPTAKNETIHHSKAGPFSLDFISEVCAVMLSSKSSLGYEDYSGQIGFFEVNFLIIQSYGCSAIPREVIQLDP
jgi:hypothetical protein